MVKAKPKAKPQTKAVRAATAHTTAGLKALRKLTREELVEWGNLVVMGKASDLLKIENDPDATGLEKILGSIVSNIIYKGDMDAFDKLLGRLIGKVEDHVRVTGEGALTRVVVTMPSNGREAKK